MGGCRCSYRNCKATTDGRTHFFHFPVWDKERCQKWIVSAQRPEFLELTISQLRNRVICQNHFSDEMFMNEQKRGLVRSAVPMDDVDEFVTIDGTVQKEPLINQPNSESLGLDESKFFTAREKMATLSVPYNLFLTKCNFDTMNDPSLKKSLASPKKRTPFHMPNFYAESRSGSECKTQHISPQRPLINIKKEAKPNETSNVVILSHETITEPLVPPQPLEMKKASPSFVLQKPKRKPFTQENKSGQVIEQRASDPPFLDSEKLDSVELETKKPPRIISVHTLPSNEKIADNFYNLPVEFVPPIGSSAEDLPKGGITFVTPDNDQIPITTTVQNEDQIRKDPIMVHESQESRSVPPIHSKHRLSMYKQKHRCRSPRKMRSLSAALMAKVNENSKDIAEIKQILQQKIKKKPNYHDNDDDLRKEYLFDEISQYISTKLKNELFQELFVNIKDRSRHDIHKYLICCRVVGIAGSDTKVDILKREYGFDEGINYKTQDVDAALRRAAPDGVDCYFDNVGGELSSTVIYQMNTFGRVAVCGSISAYNEREKPKATTVQPALVSKQLRIEGFVVWRYAQEMPAAFQQLTKWIRDGQLKAREHLTEGFDNLYDAFVGVLRGENIGKAVVKV